MPETITLPSRKNYFRHLTVNTNTGVATFSGIDAGPLSVHYQDHDVIVLKKATHTYKPGAHGRAQVPAEFYVFLLESPPTPGDGVTYYTVRYVTDFPIRKDAQQRYIR